MSIIIRGDFLRRAANIKDKNNGTAVLCWKLPDGAQSFDFCPQTVTE